MKTVHQHHDAGGQSSLNSVGNWADDNAIIYKAPAIDLMGATVNIGIEHSLQAGTATGGDGVGSARSDTYGKGTAVGVTVAYEGLTLELNLHKQLLHLQQYLFRKYLI